jgi:hypothetical protein
MSYSLKKVSEVPDELMLKLAGKERFVTHAHNPCVVEILHESFGWEGGAFLVLDNDKPVGYISCMIIKGRIVSMPHFSFGGLITRVPDRGEIYTEILPEIYTSFFGSEVADVSYLLREPDRVGVYVLNNKVVSWIDIKNKSIESALPATQRAKAGKALENRLKCTHGGIELLDDFYYVYSRNMLRLGSPVLPKRFFANILKMYTNGAARIFCVYNEKTPVGASFLMSYLGFFENTWFSTLTKYNHLFPAQLLHQEMIAFSIQQCGHTYSFGRSSVGSGVHEFKRRWRTEETIVYWNYDKPVKMDLRKAEVLVHVWKRLPLFVANLLGPFVSGWFY